MNNKIIKITIILAIIATTILGFSSIKDANPNVDPSCINLYIDKGDGKPIQGCWGSQHEVAGLSLLLRAGHYTEGTKKYPDQIICRIDGFPSYKVEPCDNMPSADAYWAILVEKNGKWSMAQVGIKDILVRPGEGIGFVFTNKGKVKYPN